MYALGDRWLTRIVVGASLLLVGCGGSDKSRDANASTGGSAGSSSDAGGASGDGGSTATGGNTGTGGRSSGGSGGVATGGASATGGDSGATFTGTPVPLSELGDAYETVVCEVLMQCERASYASVDECKADREPAALADLEAAVSEGRVVYDADAVGACRAAIEANLCNLGYLFVPSVLSIVDDCLVGEGRQMAGQPCRHDIECEDGTYCDRSATCPGICVAFAQQGQPCDDSAGPECEPAIDISLTELLSMSAEQIQQLVEQTDPIALRCIEGTCQTGSASGGPCDSNSDCLADGWCDATNVCEAAIPYGGSCAEIGSECASGLFCDQLSGVSAGVCQPLSALGGPCTFNGDCQGDLVCVQVDYTMYGVCSNLGQATDPCSFDSSCEPGLACDNNVCVALPTAGAPCLFGTDCAVGFTCVSGTCRAEALPGEPCNTTDAICVGRCLSGTCGPKAALGEACQSDDDCASRTCLNSICVDGALCIYR